MNILYIGGFKLPDKNAAAQRVVGVAKALRELGNNVIFINRAQMGGEEESIRQKEYFGFKCYEIYNSNDISYRVGVRFVKEIIRKESIDVLIAYNYPSLALFRILRFCRKHSLKSIADVTEWEKAVGNPVYRTLKAIDIKLRMDFIHPQMDGIIAISSFLFEYYRNKTKTVKIPPTVDVTDEKWIVHREKHLEEYSDNKCRLVYAGSPTPEKERLAEIVEAVQSISKKRPIELVVVGLTKDEFIKAYQWFGPIGDDVTFLGRVSHNRAIEEVAKANWSIIIRENNLKVKAGFPTKLVESISCGTPVIVNEFSNICEYLDTSNSIICDVNGLEGAIEQASNKTMKIDNSIFDYHRFLKEFQNVLTVS